MKIKENPNKIQKVQTKVKRPFDKSDIGFKKGKHAHRKNQDRYVDWVLSVLRKEYNKELEANQKFYAPSILMNRNNLYWLYSKLESFVFLGYAPTEDNELEDNEIGIDTDKIIENKEEEEND